MKREFLQALQVGEMGLSKEVIDAIMAENGKDIQAAKSAFADYEDVKAALSQAQGELETLRGQDSEGLRQAVKDWEAKFAEAEFSHRLEMVVARAGGRSQKAIAALLDCDSLKKSENLAEAVEKAVADLKEESPYLFATQEIPPLFSRGTGAYTGIQVKTPATLAGALKERFEKERK